MQLGRLEALNSMSMLFTGKNFLANFLKQELRLTEPWHATIWKSQTH